MEPITWSDAFNTGIPEMDFQHRQLIRMINRLLSVQDAAISPETIADLLNEMTQYALKHFGAEERLLKQNEFPDLEAHIASHRAYQKKTVDLCSDSVKDLQKIPEELLIFLLDWWITHVMEEDKQYGEYILARK